jgi:trehalose 6-phosphate phosphatase
MAAQDALEAFAELVARLAGRRPALFLDYDGTLTPIVDRPEDARLDPAMRATIARLASRCPVAIVSGRARPDVEALVGLPELSYAGSHGFDIEGPDGLRIANPEAEAFVPSLAAAAQRLAAAIGRIPGVIVENKTYAVAVHYRLAAPERRGEIDAAVDAAIAAAGTGLRRTGGKMIFEIRPEFDWDKGRAVLWLLDALGLDAESALPIYLGDDETDFDAFRALADRGLGIFVGAAAEAGPASFTLPDPAAVQRLLDRLATTLEEAAR